MTRWDDLVTIGRAVRPQGRHGEIVVHSLSDSPQRFASLRRVWVPGPDGGAREVEVLSSRPHQGRFVLKLKDVDSIEAAEGYRGVDLRIPEGDLDPLPPGSYYLHQLKGLEVVDPSGQPHGHIRDLLETGAATVLVIADGEKEILVPLAFEFVSSVDLATGRAVVRLPEFWDVES